MANRESWGAVLFLAALLAGAVFLFSGLYAPGPERAGVLLPQRSAAYVTRLSRDLGRSAPGISGQAEAVKPTPLLDAVQEKIAAAEPAATSLLDRNHLFIQLSGAAQRLTQRQVVDDADPRYSVVRLTDGTLTFVNAEEVDTASHGKALARLRDQLGKRDIPLLYLQAPGKVAPEDDRLPAGVTDHSNDYADALLAELEVHGVDYVDFRDLFAAMEDRDWSSWFFATDHHWTPEAAFTACGALFELLMRLRDIGGLEACDAAERIVGLLFPDGNLGFLHNTLQNNAVQKAFLLCAAQRWDEAVDALRTARRHAEAMERLYAEFGGRTFRYTAGLFDLLAADVPKPETDDTDVDDFLRCLKNNRCFDPLRGRADFQALASPRCGS